ncbi:DUF1674 domain-containing protein [Muricoccus radiodurans]|uniref:DUF1674 domain-containing protein n=1 Tax=Muricoccus radiodurans TaxID=2231721 RepID=UPI003CF59D62
MSETQDSKTPPVAPVSPEDPRKGAAGEAVAPPAPPLPPEIGGPKGPEPTRYGDWERKGRVSDF